MMITNEKAINLAIKTIRNQIKIKPSGGYKTDEGNFKYPEIIAQLEILKNELKLPINHKCKDCANFAGKPDGTGGCFPQTNYTSSRTYNDGCTCMFIPKRGKNLLDEFDK